MPNPLAVAKYPKPPKTPAVIVYDDGRECCSDTKAGRAEYILRTFQMALRQRGLCGICRKPLGEDVTFDHQRGRGLSGGFREDRIIIDGKWHNAAVHFLCNGKKSCQPYGWVEGLYVPTTSRRSA